MKNNQTTYTVKSHHCNNCAHRIELHLVSFNSQLWFEWIHLFLWYSIFYSLKQPDLCVLHKLYMLKKKNWNRCDFESGDFHSKWSNINKNRNEMCKSTDILQSNGMNVLKWILFYQFFVQNVSRISPLPSNALSQRNRRKSVGETSSKRKKSGWGMSHWYSDRKC